ncbi:copper chaperone PCu(A)C [Modestobacter sp. I12A-02662]|uniref:copper chaperone PCu(A)C n=1 Tax=Modestobacter sp. I12A-02662 TaxID=1730496 RepID=UPI0034DE25BE
MNRALRAAAMGALLLSPAVLTACSAGQVAQTATQEQNLGNTADVGPLALRGLQLAYPTGGVYAAGSDARLIGTVASSATVDDTLVGIEGDGFTDVDVVDPSAPAAGAGAAGQLSIDVPARGTVTMGTGQGPSVTLVGLTEELTVGQYLDVTFTFEEAGAVTVAVPVGVASRDLPRGEAFDWHEEEGGEEPPTEAGTAGGGAEEDHSGG